ncbi:glutathione S-transferase [Microcoleus sp. FACHB-68]|uniref:glutathione S-transferase family protein n=1 Tax=Microcoleus sp. FACHB-68 TaxID=2692826 RepID=UPI00168A2E67|nr:glutathione S-transferase [Microcoleus sp. FACHB-68]MBD1939560.1 glutathione S-transferase [Microcoleus sp. FACHB-68]
MIELYNHELSGNCYKVRLMLSLLGLEHELVPVDLIKGEQKAAEFLKLNPLGQVPVLTDGEVVIRDAQAILVYLGRRYGGEDWLPVESESMSKVVQWLTVAANEIQHSLATARLYFLFNAQINLELAQQKAHQILQILNEHLAMRSWLECERPTIADVACFPYVGLGADGKISLEAYPHVVTWCERIKQLPGYIGMPGLLVVTSARRQWLTE